MKTLLYIIALLLIIIWVIAFQPSGAIHLVLLLAALIVMGTIIFGKRLSGKSDNIK